MLHSGTLRSGKEFSTHGAIVLQDFDVLQHLHTARTKANEADNASDDYPISVPGPGLRIDRRDPSPSPPRSHSPPRRSSRLAPPVNEAIDREGRTRAAHRATAQARLGTSLKRVVRKHVDNAEPIQITTNPEDYPVTSTGWAGIRDNDPDPHEYTLSELQQKHGMQLVEWDGRCVFFLF